jgi:hypothetical protein
MLPGMAAISMFLLFVSMFTAFHMLRAGQTPPAARYSVLAVCTLIVVGVFGLLRLQRWGWALVCGGCVLGAGANFWTFHMTRMGPYLVQGLFLMLFFLYMSRPEVRERLR